MEYLILIVVIALIWYFVSGRGKTQARRSAPIQSELDSTSNCKASVRHVENELDWLRERWKLADSHRQSGRDSIFPHWYFDEATDRQKSKLTDLGIETGPDVTKGQASDLIGIYEPADEHDLAVLRFFKCPVKSINQTRARHEVARIFKDPANVRVWEERPPSQEQKEFFKFFGVKPEKGMTAPQAEELIRQHEAKLSENDDPKLEEWEACVEIMDELSDPEVRSDYDLKNPSRSLIQAALEELKNSGKTYREVADDIDLLIDKLVEMKPDLQRD